MAPYEKPPLAYSSSLAPVVLAGPGQLLQQPAGLYAQPPPSQPTSWHPEQPVQPAARARADGFSQQHPVNQIHQGTSP
ncbi:MAG: hypothetical protein G8345_21980 [Magnetococcales bacterium]|nr:hypothetical protein [Magnetococcales bacterium]NGZ29545.1 hypothetical protein [Magnetococcales bacterium]